MSHRFLSIRLAPICSAIGPFVAVQLNNFKIKAADFLSRRRVEAKSDGSARFRFPGDISSPLASKTFNRRQGRINFRDRRFNSDSMNDVYMFISF